MSDVKVILTDEVRGLGNRGEVVSVAAGYARNFLLPKELAYLATPGNVKRLEQEKKRYDVSQAKEKDQAATVAKAFEGLTRHRPQEGGRARRDLRFRDGRPSWPKRWRPRGSPSIAAGSTSRSRSSASGQHTVHVRLHREVIATLKVEVVAA